MTWPFWAALNRLRLARYRLATALWAPVWALARLPGVNARLRRAAAAYRRAR